MARKKRREQQTVPCRGCGALPDLYDFPSSEDRGRWFRDLCPVCREQRSQARRQQKGQSLLDRAKVTVVVRDGHEFVVRTLAPERSGR